MDEKVKLYAPEAVNCISIEGAIYDVVDGSIEVLPEHAEFAKEFGFKEKPEPKKKGQ